MKNFINLTNKEKEMIRVWRDHRNIRKWMYQDHIISPREHFNFINQLKCDNKNFWWLVYNKDISTGVIYLNRCDFKNKNAYLGIYSNPEKSNVGKILMDCLKKIAFKIAGLHTLKLEVIENNEHAINFYKKSGFTEEGQLKEFVFKNDKWLDVIVMGLTNKND